MKQRVLAVVGATGNQGGSVARAVLADRSSAFTVRAITRDPSKPQARALAALGAEVVRADLDDPATIRTAFEGAYGAYCVTNYWERASAEHEKGHARTMADAARAAGVEHVIWSTLEDTRAYMPADDARMPLLQGRYRVPNYDAKGEANAYFEGVPTTFLTLSYFWDNLLVPGYGPMKGADGAYSWALPMGDAKLVGMAVEDIGRCAYGIFKAGTGYVGKTVGVVGGSLTIGEIVERLSGALGVGRIRYDDVDPDVYRGFGFPGADVVGNMYQFYRDFEDRVLALRSTSTTRVLDPGVLSFDDWLAKNKARIPL